MPVSYGTLKQNVLQGYKRHTFASGTVTSNSNLTTFIDTSRQEPDRFWSLDGADVWVKFSTGSNNGLVRKVTGYSTNSSFVFAPAVTASLASGDGYALFKSAHPDNDIGPAINDSLRFAFPNRVVASVATTHEIDATYTYSVASQVASTVNQLREIRRSVGTINNDHNFTILQRGFDYELLDTGGSLTLQLQYLPVPSTVLTFIGERPAGELAVDTDTTDEPQAVILAGARHFLALQEGNKELASFWGAEYERAKHQYEKSVPPRQLQRPMFHVGRWS